jgi:hypothetical protein
MGINILIASRTVNFALSDHYTFLAIFVIRMKHLKGNEYRPSVAARTSC